MTLWEKKEECISIRPKEATEKNTLSILKKEKVTKGARGMPRLSKAKKDVISCEKPWSLANTIRTADFRMGQPICHKADIQRCWKQTRGTETSHYPEENKTKVIPLVVASEAGTAQTLIVQAIKGLKDRI